MNTIEISMIYANSLGRFLECEMAKGDCEEFANHPSFIIFAGTRYTKSGWNSDRGIIYYKV